jgi:hypothetical protein
MRHGEGGRATNVATLDPQGSDLVSRSPSGGTDGLGERSEQGKGFFIKFGGEANTQARIGRMRQALWGAAHFLSLAPKGHRAPVAWMVTLTYARADGWRSDHMSECIRLWRRWCKFRGLACRYAWVAEIQDGTRKERVEGQGVVRGRGAVHYHLMVWLPQGVSAPFFDCVQRVGARTRSVIWPHGMSERDIARTSVGYLMKYASKGNREGYAFPKGLRVFGIGGLDELGKSVRSWLGLPEWCKRLYGCGQVVRKAGRLVVRDSGEVLESPWLREQGSGGLFLRLARPMAPRWFSGPYSMIGGAA